MITDLVIPRVCAGCGVSIGSDGPVLCNRCATDMSRLVGGYYCETCGEDKHPHLLIEGSCGNCRLRKRGHLRFDRFIRVGRYAGALRAMILRFKHEIVLEHPLGSLMADAVQSRVDSNEVDLWIPVPSHWYRRFRRRYQPTALLARQTARRFGGRVAPVLRMTRYVHQFHVNVTLTRQARVKAIAGAFKVVPGVSVAGRCVCLIDDVTNTGATLAEARRTLRAAGARRILAAVLAKTSSLPEPERALNETLSES
ncbi:MAG: ComF family protein [Phycisphaerae bacterium]